MKIFVQFLALSMIGFLLTSCDPFDGVLDVKKAFTVTTTNNDDILVPEGTKNAELEFLSRDRIRIKMQIAGKDQKLTMNLPKNQNIPQNGDFLIPAADLKQTFSVKGHVVTNRTNSQITHAYEQCTYTRHETVCDQNGCHQIIRTIYGQQRVEYYTQTTQQKISVNFINTTVLAIFNGSKSASEKIYSYRENCF